MSWSLGRYERVCAVIDLGSHRTSCALMSYSPSLNAVAQPQAVTVHGFAAGPSVGWQAGMLVDVGAAGRAIRRVLGRAERAAGVEAESVFVVSSFQSMRGEAFRAGLPLRGEAPSRHDFATVIAAATEHAERGFRRAIHVLPTGYALEPSGEAHGPEATAYLSVDFQTVSIAGIEEANLRAIVERALVEPEAVAAAPYTGALAVTSAEDREMGVIVLDFGARTTSAVWFAGGVLEHLAVVAEGGQHITARIARSLGLDGANAERIKLRHGSVFDRLLNDEPVTSDLAGDKEPVFKSQLNGVIRERLGAILLKLKAKLELAGLTVEGAEPVVLTGGGSALPGVSNLAGQIFARKACVGEPVSLTGLRREAASSALTGGCLFVASEEWRNRANCLQGVGQKGGYAARIGQWLRTGF